jgi:hypothetical protein
MAKAKSAAPPAAPDVKQKTGKRAAASEIDDIFSNTKKAKLAVPPPADVAGSDGPAKKKKGKKGKAAGAAAGGAEAEGSSKTVEAVKEQPAAAPKRVPVEVHDPSKAIESYKPDAAPMATKVLGPDATDAEKKAAEEEERFMDSRGTRTPPSPSPTMIERSHCPSRNRTKDGGRLAHLRHGGTQDWVGRRCVWLPLALTPARRADHYLSVSTETELCPFDCDCCALSPFFLFHLAKLTLLLYLQ